MALVENQAHPLDLEAREPRMRNFRCEWRPVESHRLKSSALELTEKNLTDRGNLPIEVTPPLDGHPGLGAILLDRAKQGVLQWRL